MAQGYMSGTGWHVQYPYKKIDDDDLYKKPISKEDIKRVKNTKTNIVEMGDTITVIQSGQKKKYSIVKKFNGELPLIAKLCLNKKIDYKFSMNGEECKIYDIVKGYQEIIINKNVVKKTKNKLEGIIDQDVLDSARELLNKK